MTSAIDFEKFRTKPGRKSCQPGFDEPRQRMFNWTWRNWRWLAEPSTTTAP